MTKGKFKVRINKRGVFFSIDHQTFQVDYSPAEKGDPEEKYNAPRRKWYKKQLTTALKRLAEFGNKKTNGRQSRNTKKTKAGHAKQSRQNVRTRPR